MEKSRVGGQRRRWGIATALIALVASGTPAVARGQIAASPRERAAALSGAWTIGTGPVGPVEALLALPGGGGLPAELVAGGTGRVAVSTDGGASWHASYNTPSLSGAVTDLLATGDGAASSLLAGTTTGLFRSADRGLHWQQVLNGLPLTTGVQTLARAGATLYAGTGDQSSTGAFGGSGLYVSHDDGVTWAPMSLPSGAGPFISTILASSGGAIYVATVSGTATTLTSQLYLRTPGTTFHLADTGLDPKLRVHALAVAGSTVIAGTGGGFYLSGDGSHWKVAVQGGLRPFIYTVVRDPARPRVVYGGSLGSGLADPGAGIWQSDDGGQTWHPSSLGLPTYMDVHAIAIVARPGAQTTYYAATDGVWRSHDALHWSASSSGLNFGAVRALLADPAHPGVLVTGVSYSGFYRSSDGGHSWKVANQGLLNNEPQALARGGSGTIYAATEAQVVRWDSATGSWKSLDAHLNRSRALTAFGVGPLPGAIDVLYVAGAFGKATSFALLRSTDLGHTWKTLTLPGTAGRASPIRRIAVATTDPNVVYVATDTALFVSGDGGATWTSAGPTPGSSTAITALSIDPATSQTVYMATVVVDQNATSTATALTGATVYRTLDGGVRWTPVRRYGGGTLILQVHPGPRTLVVGAQLSGQRVLGLVDEQSSGGWRSLTAGLPDGVYGNVADTDGTRLYLGTGQHGVWTRDLAGGPAPTGGPPGKGSGPTPTPVLPGPGA